MGSLVVSPPLLGDVVGGGTVIDGYGVVASTIGSVTVGQRLGSRGGPSRLRLRGIVNDDDLLWETVLVKVVPVGLPGAPSLAHRLGLGWGCLCGHRHGCGGII